MDKPVRPVPEDGDIVVREEKREGTLVFVLRTIPGADQILVRTREEADARTLAFATRQHVRAWRTDGGDGFALLHDFRQDEWSVFRGAHPHALLIGSEARAQAAIARLLQYLRAPLVYWHPRVAAEPPHARGTLVIWAVDTLDRVQQEQLLRWMDHHARDTQVISVAERPLFPLALRGEFLDVLYYRLNMVCLPLPGSVEASPDTPLPRSGRDPQRPETRVPLERELRGAVSSTKTLL